MKIEPSSRRREITDLFVKGDSAGLERLGLKMSQSPSADCAHYVIVSLGIIPSPRAFDALRSLPKSETPYPGSNIISYDNGSKNVHYGFYDDEKVTSKWGEGPVFTHAIEDIPLKYGNFVKFTSRAAALDWISSADNY